MTAFSPRVLVVEDEWLLAMMIEEHLRDAGAGILGPAACVSDALTLIEGAGAEGGIAAAVLDIRLRGETVMPVADALHALGVPFVFATGYSHGFDRGQHHAAPVLVKPFDGEALRRAVNALGVPSTMEGAGAAPGLPSRGRGVGRR